MYGLNDPKSENYVADQNERIRIAAALQSFAADTQLTAGRLLEEWEIDLIVPVLRAQ